MSVKMLPGELPKKIEMARVVLPTLGYKLDDIYESAIFFADSNDIYFGINFGRKDDGYVSVNLAMTVENPVDLEQRFKALNEVARKNKVIKAYYDDESFILSSEAFLKTEKDFIEFINYSVPAMLNVYTSIDEDYPRAL